MEKGFPLTSKNPLVVGEFYDGAYGPTIILVLSSITAAKWLRRVFLEQIDNAEPHDLSVEPHMRASNMSSLRLITRASGREIELKRVSDKPAPSFTIYGTRSGWQYVAELIDPFCNGQSGHQYFADLAGDDALVEVSFGEGPMQA